MDYLHRYSNRKFMFPLREENQNCLLVKSGNNVCSGDVGIQWVSSVKTMRTELLKGSCVALCSWSGRYHKMLLRFYS